MHTIEHSAELSPPPIDHLAHVTIIDEAGMPVAETDLSSRDANNVISSMVAEEVKLSTQYDVEVVKTAESQALGVVRATTALSFAVSGKEAKAADPMKAAFHYLIELPQEKQSEAASATTESVPDTDDSGTKKMSAAELFGDDDDDQDVDAELNKQAAKAARDLQLDLEMHAKMSASGQAELLAEDGIIEKTTLSFEAVVVAARGLELQAKAAENAHNEALAEELQSVETRLELVLVEAILHGAVVSHVPRRITERLRRAEQTQLVA